MQAECVQLRATYNGDYPPIATLRQASAPTGSHGMGTNTNPSVSMQPPLHGPGPPTLTSPVETFDHRKQHQRKQLDAHWNQLHHFLSTCPAEQLLDPQKAYDDYLKALENFEIKFPPEMPPVCSASPRTGAGATAVGIHFVVPTGHHQQWTWLHYNGSFRTAI